MSPTTGVQLFRRDIKGRQGGGVTLYIRKRLDCAAIAVMDDVVESLWLRIKGTDSKAHVVSVYYWPPTQNDGMDKLFYWQLGEISGMVALIFMGDISFADINWESIAATRTTVKSLKRDNFLSQVLSEQTRKGTLLDLLENWEGLVGEVMVGVFLGHSEHWVWNCWCKEKKLSRVHHVFKRADKLLRELVSSISGNLL